MRILPCRGQPDLTYLLLSDRERDQLIAVLCKPKADDHGKAFAQALRDQLKEARRA